MKKCALFAFNGEFMCFIHVLLNALDMQAQGHDVKVVMEGSATKLIPELATDGNPMHQLYRKARSQGLIDGVCKACSSKMGVLAQVEEEGLPLVDEMSGHPSMARYMAAGYEILIF